LYYRRRQTPRGEGVFLGRDLSRIYAISMGWRKFEKASRLFLREPKQLNEPRAGSVIIEAAFAREGKRS